MNIWLNSAWMFVVLSVVAQGRPDAWLTICFPYSPPLHFLHITCHLGLDLFHKPNKGLALVVILCQLTFNAKQQMSLPCGCGHAAVSRPLRRQSSWILWPLPDGARQRPQTTRVDHHLKHRDDNISMRDHIVEPWTTWICWLFLRVRESRWLLTAPCYHWVKSWK